MWFAFLIGMICGATIGLVVAGLFENQREIEILQAMERRYAAMVAKGVTEAEKRELIDEHPFSEGTRKCEKTKLQISSAA